MKDQTIYAVVDIETTGTNTEKDKMIQFACVLVQDRKIINHFSTDINPLQNIPKHIENLTGINNKQVAQAPYFEDVALIIKNLLTDCVFVAHNVYFDFGFLNSELERAGLTPLNLPCIDTVELAQIMLPQSFGFRVSDLAEYLEIAHENPHEALSDAMTTAEIFIKLVKKIDDIPYVTLKKMADLSVYLGVENYLIFEKSLNKKETHELNGLLDQVKTIEMISLRYKSYDYNSRDNYNKMDYPVTKADKKSFIEPIYHYRKEQEVMMDAIFEFSQEENKQKNLLVEASTGTGKSMGYLFPLNFQNKKPIIVSTSTILLQEQLLNKNLKELEDVVKEKVNGVILKSSRHFIDLDKFYKTLILQPNTQKQYVINQMAVLNWLRWTETGDLDEINLNKKHIFFDHIEHLGIHTLDKGSLFYEEDFLRYLEDKKEYADFIIVNHAFLCEESFRKTPLIPESTILVIDEAHKLTHTLEEKQLKKISFKILFHLLRKLKEVETIQPILQLLAIDDLSKHVDLLVTLSHEAKEDLQWLEAYIIRESQLTDKKREVRFEVIGSTDKWPNAIRKNLKELLLIFKEMLELIVSIENQVAQIKPTIKVENYFDFLDYMHQLTILKENLTSFIAYFKRDSSELTQLISLENQQLVLKEIDFSSVSIQKTTWYPAFEKIIFTSGTLQLDISSDYFEKQLDLPEPKKLILKENFCYEDHAKLMVITDYHKEKMADFQAYVTYISDTIFKSYDALNSSILVLFTSHEVLKQVYYQLAVRFEDNDVSLYAQGITGTKEKIVKRFSKEGGGIILGANSFWEGVDLNLPELELIIMTKLPFDPPKRPLIEGKYRYLESIGKDPFYDEALPQAGSRLRQGVGRLIRNERDYGAVIVLDSRLTTSSYSKQLLKYLPKGLPIKESSLTNALVELKQFFTEKKMKDCYNKENTQGGADNE